MAVVRGATHLCSPNRGRWRRLQNSRDWFVARLGADRSRRPFPDRLVVWHGISVTYSSWGQAASAGSALWRAAMRSSRAFRSFLVNFHSNGVGAICS